MYKTGQHKRIRDKWLGDDLKPQGVPWAALMKYGGIAGALLCAALSITLLWFRTLKNQVAQRTAALALEVRERRRA
ncbi:MAG: histidine kinase, partial [candidate division WOR-3 bacterium]